MSYWKEQITIGNRSFPRFIGGPLDGITDSPFRKVVREFSPDALLYSEMRHTAFIACDKFDRALQFEQMERPLNFQIATNKLDFLDQALDKIVASGVDAVDLNVGCPAKNVIRSGSGSSLMARPDELKTILLRMRAKLSIPLTIKIRAGFQEVNAVEIAQLAQDCGVDALAIHPRLRGAFFTGIPNYNLVADVKKALTIPVIISGNVVNWHTAKMVYEQTGVDGFLIGRGIWGKPWKLLELQEHSQGRPFTIDKHTIFSYAKQHFGYMLDHYGSKGLFCFRKHLPFYIKGFSGAVALRRELTISTSQDVVLQALCNLEKEFRPS